MGKELFILSGTSFKGLEFYLFEIENFLGEPQQGSNRILFIPYADPDCDYDGYTGNVSKSFKKFGYEVVGIHTYQHPTLNHIPSDCFDDETICAVCIGDGNTWLLNYALQNLCITKRIKEKVEQGKWKYISSGAGTIVACPSMLTTNDFALKLPLVDDKAIGLVPFQITHNSFSSDLGDIIIGGTIEERIRQVILYNPDWQIVGLPELGCWIQGKGEEYILGGTEQAVIFRKDGNNSLWLPGEPFNNIGML